MQIRSTGTTTPAQYREIDGRNNNVENPSWGSAGSAFRADVPLDFADGISAPSGGDRPNAREVSNAVCPFEGWKNDRRRLSQYVWIWGQFLDHDITHTAESSEAWNIAVPAGDPTFDPHGTGRAIIPMTRSQLDPTTTPRLPINRVTAWIDASTVYGSTPERAAALRAFEGGRLKSGGDNHLPFNVDGLPNSNPTRLDPASMYVAGDERANENLAVTSLHTIFMREHNRLAAEISAADPTLSDEQIYQRARKIVGAQIQAITYNEFVPALLGENALPRYQGYRPDVEPTIGVAFATAAYRTGHTQTNDRMMRIDADGKFLKVIHMEDAIFHPERLAQPDGMEAILRGVARHMQPQMTPHMADPLRNTLFGPPGAGGLDLAALDIQRGRDHGLPAYNEVRAAFGLHRRETFAEITKDVEVQRALEQTYGTVDRLDPWVGMVAEDVPPHMSVGPTTAAMLIDQFTRLRDGDRFWYQNDPELAPMRHELDALTLRDVIERNSNVKFTQDNLFVVPPKRMKPPAQGGGQAAAAEQPVASAGYATAGRLPS